MGDLNLSIMNLSDLFFSVSKTSRRIAIRLSSNNEWRNILKAWKQDLGERVLRLNYDNLNENSLVIDLGGYQGQWASDIYARYRCKVVVFEPYQKYAEEIEERFRKNPDVKVFALGLSDVNKDLKISIDEESSSTFKAQNATKTAEISLKQADTFLNQYDYTVVDLMKINIEGGEYDLLDHLIETGLIKNIANLQIQFHDFVPNAEHRMSAIQKALSNTHELTYQYRFLWENWKLK